MGSINTFELFGVRSVPEEELIKPNTISGISWFGLELNNLLGNLLGAEKGEFMELCESVSPGEDNLFSAFYDMTGTHGLSHSSRAFGAVVNFMRDCQRWTSSLELNPSICLHKKVHISTHCLRALLIWRDK